MERPCRKKPPIKAGITIKNIIKMACAVMILLYNWLSAMNCVPGPLNSNLINTENAVPNNPENNAKIKYKVPLEMEPASRPRSPQRTVRASHPAHGSTADQPA